MANEVFNLKDFENGKIFHVNGRDYLWTYSPQFGGYCAKCLIDVTVEEDNDCFEVWIWHDGEFPRDDWEPIILHCCDAEQFIRFGQKILDTRANLLNVERKVS